MLLAINNVILQVDCAVLLTPPAVTVPERAATLGPGDASVTLAVMIVWIAVTT